jgi:hypothetical protein
MDKKTHKEILQKIEELEPIDEIVIQKRSDSRPGETWKKSEITRIEIGQGYIRTDYSDGKMVIESRGKVGIGV